MAQKRGKPMNMRKGKIYIPLKGDKLEGKTQLYFIKRQIF